PEIYENYFADAMMHEYGLDLTADPQPNFIPFPYVHGAAFGGGPNWHTIIATMNCGGFAALLFTFNATCSIIIVRKIEKSNISEASHRLHLALLRALIIQFSVPVVLCVIPFFLLIGLPITGLSFNLTGNVLGLMVSFFPVVDPICMILAYSK
ncbi:hypothetical protein PMAYCL1PPCAC_16597, partial [Pristionchus mayeri]